MFDKRKPLPQGWELVFGEEHRYVIAEEIGRGGSCIVYNGFTETGSVKDIWLK